MDANVEPDVTRRPSVYWAVLETLIITLALPVIGSWLRPQDPFFMHEDFPWLIMAPLLASLRYGFAHGFGSSLGLVMLIAAAWRMHWQMSPEFPAGFVLGILAVGMVAGEFSDMWSKREAQQVTIATYHRRRLDEFTRAYHMLRVSHDRLEQRLAASSQSLRFCLLQVRKLLLASPGERNVLGNAAEAIMGVFGDFSWLQAAELYYVDSSGQFSEKPLARLGNVKSVRPEVDPLVREAMRCGELVSVRSGYIEEFSTGSSEILVAVPFIDVNGRIWAMLTVHEMPFISFQRQNLMLLAVMGGYIADQISSVSGKEADEDVLSNVFLREADRALIQLRKYNLPTTVQAINIRDPDLREDLVNVLTSRVRGLDRTWLQRATDQSPVLFLLMPLTNEAQASSYRARIGRQLRELYGREADELGVVFNGREIMVEDTVEELMNYLCEVGGVDRLDILHHSRSDG